MTIEELCKNYGKVEVPEEVLKKLGICAEVDRLERCEVGDYYYYIDAFYAIASSYDDLRELDGVRYETGNYYPCAHWSEEEVRVIAERKKKKAIAENKVKRRIAELNEGWKLNWKYVEQEKWVVAYCPESGGFIGWMVHNKQRNRTWEFCKSKEIVEQIIKELGAELKIMLEVEEEVE